MSWPNVPVAIQKKILSGTMTEEDWISDWDELNAVEEINVSTTGFRNIKLPPDPFSLRERSYDPPPSYKREIEDVVSSMLNASEHPIARHVHVFRKEYPKCLLKGCGALRSHHSG